MTAPDWEALVYSHLVTTGTALSALVGTRVYPLVLPQAGALPAVVYTLVDDVETLNGHNGVARVQFTAWATTYAGAKSVRDALRERLRSFAGQSSTDRVEDVDVSFSGPAGLEPELGLYRRDLDTMIYHRRH